MLDTGSDRVGQRLIEAQMLFSVPTTYAAMFAACALGHGHGPNLLFLALEARFAPWSGR